MRRQQRLGALAAHSELLEGQGAGAMPQRGVLRHRLRRRGGWSLLLGDSAARRWRRSLCGNRLADGVSSREITAENGTTASMLLNPDAVRTFLPGGRRLACGDIFRIKISRGPTGRLRAPGVTASIGARSHAG
jgi:hypothetical protein